MRGNRSYVLAHGDRLAVEFGGDPSTRHLVPSVVLLHGLVLADDDRFVEARDYLEHGLAMHATLPTSRDLTSLDRFELELVRVCLVLGDYGRAEALATTLEEPNRAMETRLGAIRSKAMLATIHGNYETAHQLINAAASLVERIHSRLFATLLDADRAMVLGTQGRLPEAILLADNCLRLLAQPGAGPHLRWAAAQSAALALTLGRYAAEAGDLSSAQRLVLTGVGCAERLGGTYMRAHADLTISTMWWAQGRYHQAVDVVRSARRTFVQLGTTPSAALATLQEGRVAWAQGLSAAAQPLLRQALNELAGLGHHREVEQLRVALGALDHGHAAQV
jgi:ATP/maltotriose-dependent transcriptional regulator MalT